VVQSASIDDGSFSLSDVPLGTCDIEVTVSNVHGRIVLGGEALDVDVQRGENASLTIQLLERHCGTPACDSDGDGLADVDEDALGIDAERLDTDDDGLEDGLELVQCCTDPLIEEGECTKQLIQRVEPGMGTVGTALLIKTAAPLSEPQISVGGAALQSPLAEGTLVFGMVGQGAVLGEVELTDKSSVATYKDLFAVLDRSPELVTELSHRAGAGILLMSKLVDQAFADRVQFLLGRGQTSSSDSSSSVVSVPLLIIRDGSGVVRQGMVRASGQPSATGEPVALAVGPDRLLVLLSNKGQAELVLYELDIDPIKDPIKFFASGKRVTIDDQSALAQMVGPVDIVLEPSGDVALMLLKNLLVRFRFDASGLVSQATAITSDGLFEKLAAVGIKLENKVSLGCTGLAHAAEQGAVHLGCNLSRACAPGQPCNPLGVLVRIKLDSCMPFGNAGSITQPSLKLGTCLFLYPFKQLARSVGAPVVDARGKRVYQLSTAGVFAAPVSGPSRSANLHAPLPYEGQSDSPDLMALDDRFLFVANGSMVWVMEPALGDPARRRGKPFVVGQGNEQAQMLALDGEGGLLSVARTFGGFGSLMSVCVKPCN
jgi:hypothetical protein